MDDQKPRSRATLIAAAVLVVVIGAALVFVVLGSPSGTSSTGASTSESTTQASGGSVLFASGVSPEGLQLQMTLNSSGMQSRGAISAQIEVLNTLNRNVSSAVVENENMSMWNAYDNLCGSPSDSFVGFAVFRGDVSAGNISAAAPPLQLTPPYYLPCALSITPSNVIFLPSGDQAIATINPGQTTQSSYNVTVAVNATTRSCVGKGTSGQGGEIDCGASPGLLGYWNYSIASGGDFNFTSPAFVYFPPGQYTIVAADDWNQYVYAYFVVA